MRNKDGLVLSEVRRGEFILWIQISSLGSVWIFVDLYMSRGDFLGFPVLRVLSNTRA